MTGRDLTTIECIDEAIRRMECDDDDADLQAWTWGIAALRMARKEIERLRADAALGEAYRLAREAWKDPGLRAELIRTPMDTPWCVMIRSNFAPVAHGPTDLEALTAATAAAGRKT